MIESITAERVLAALNGEYGDPTIILTNLIAFLLGLALHVVHKTQSEQVTFIQYWSLHRANSIVSLIALTATFISMALMAPESPLYAYFATAYMGNSLINKSPVNYNMASERGVRNAASSLDGVVERDSVDIKRLIIGACLFVIVMTPLFYAF